MAHRLSSLKPVLCILRDGGDRQQAGVLQSSSVPSWGQKPRAQEQGLRRSQGMGQSPTGHFLSLLWRILFRVGTGASWKEAMRMSQFLPRSACWALGRSRWIKEYPHSWKGP